MLILTQTTDLLQVRLNGAHGTAPLDIMTCWRDIGSESFLPGRTLTRTNGVTAVNAVPAPASGIQRVVDYLSVINSDSVNQVVTIQLSDNGTVYELYQVVLGPNERVEYVEGHGFRTYNSAGAEKLVTTATNNVVSSGLSMVVLDTDIINNNAIANTIANITGLSFPVVAGQQIYFRFMIRYLTAATTTGARFSLLGPASPTYLGYDSRYSLTATTETNNRSLQAYDLPAASNVTASSSLAGGNIAEIMGFIRPSADGTVIGRFASEIANSAVTVKAGSFVEYQVLL